MCVIFVFSGDRGRLRGEDLSYPGTDGCRILAGPGDEHEKVVRVPADPVVGLARCPPVGPAAAGGSWSSPPPHHETISRRRTCPHSRPGRTVLARSRMVPTFPVCRSARMGALLCPDSLAVPTPQPFGTAPGPEDFSGSGVGGPHVGQPRTASRPRSTRLEPVQRLRSFNRRFLTYTFWPRLPDPHRLAVPARPVVVGAASRPSRHPPGRTGPSFYRTAATARRWWSCTSTRSHKTSWRTHASLEDITFRLQLAYPLVLLVHLPAQPAARCSALRRPAPEPVRDHVQRAGPVPAARRLCAGTGPDAPSRRPTAAPGTTFHPRG